jgi:hypothetical protein
MAGLVPAIHAFGSGSKGVDARDKPAHDGKSLKLAMTPDQGRAGGSETERTRRET